MNSRPSTSSARLAALLLAAAATSLGGASLAWAQPAGASADAAATPKDLLEDFLHFVRIRSDDAALATGQALLDLNLDPRVLVDVVEAGDVARFNETTQRALKIATLEPIAGALIRSFEDGKLARARDPKEIARNIDLLASNDRGRLLARQRLVQAGEFAVPQLLEAFLNTENRQRAIFAQQTLVALGRQAVLPLSVALLGATPTQQEAIAGVLAQLAYPTSIPFLADLASTTDVQGVREAATAAMTRLGRPEGDTASLYRRLAESYYAQRSDVTSFPGEAFQLLWSYDPRAGGLVMREIRTEVFHEAMSMRLAERAMELESATGGVTSGTLALWVASNFSRQIDTPEGYANPAYPTADAAEAGQEARPGATYFGIASGAAVAQQVLARAIDDRDTPLARLSLDALARTAGRETLIAPAAGTRSPVLEAITYPNRRVQVEAALAVANAGPTTPFAGSDRVVPTLASAVTGLDAQHAAIIAPDLESYQSLRGTLEAGGFTVLPQAATVAEAGSVLADAPSVELLVLLGGPADRVPQAITDARGSARTAATPVLVLTSQEGYIDLGRRYENDASIAVRPVGLAAETLSAAVSDLILRASGGPISAEEAAGYSTLALDALRSLAISGNAVLNAAEASAALVAALPAASGETRAHIADVLAHVQDPRAQRALADAAIDGGGDDQLLMLEALARSAQRSGNQLEARHVERLVELAGDADEQVATSAAAALGSLNLPNDRVLPLILQGR